MGITKEENIRTKKRLIALHGSSCQYCDTPLSLEKCELEHMLPRSQGGKKAKNLTIACSACNHAKGKRTVEEHRNNLKLKMREGIWQSMEIAIKTTQASPYLTGEEKLVLENKILERFDPVIKLIDQLDVHFPLDRFLNPIQEKAR